MDPGRGSLRCALGLIALGLMSCSSGPEAAIVSAEPLESINSTTDLPRFPLRLHANHPSLRAGFERTGCFEAVIESPDTAMPDDVIAKLSLGTYRLPVRGHGESASVTLECELTVSGPVSVTLFHRVQVTITYPNGRFEWNDVHDRVRAETLAAAAAPLAFKAMQTPSLISALLRHTQQVQDRAEQQAFLKRVEASEAESSSSPTTAAIAPPILNCPADVHLKFRAQVSAVDKAGFSRALSEARLFGSIEVNPPNPTPQALVVEISYSYDAIYYSFPAKLTIKDPTLSDAEVVSCEIPFITLGTAADAPSIALQIAAATRALVRGRAIRERLERHGAIRTNVARARELLDRRELREAERCYSECLELEPYHHLFWLRAKGRALGGQYEAALEDLEKVKPQLTATGLSYFGLWNAYLGRYDRAMAALNAAVSKDPSEAFPLRYRAFVRLLQGGDSQLASALSDLNTSLTKEETADGLILRSCVLMLQRKRTEAVRDLEMAESLGGSKSRVFFLRMLVTERAPSVDFRSKEPRTALPADSTALDRALNIREHEIDDLVLRMSPEEALAAVDACRGDEWEAREALCRKSFHLAIRFRIEGNHPQYKQLLQIAIGTGRRDCVEWSLARDMVLWPPLAPTEASDVGRQLPQRTANREEGTLNEADPVEVEERMLRQRALERARKVLGE